MTPDGSYCGEGGGEQCRRCLEDLPTAKGGSIEAWRENSAAFLGRAARVFAPSFDVAGRLRRHFPQAHIVTARHPEPASPPAPLARPLPEAGRPLVIAVLGAMSRHKGADTLEACARDAKKRGLPLSFELIGHAYRRLSVRPRSTLTVHGRYREQELQGLLRAVSPHLVWFPARVPETYSYTLSETLRSALPVVVPNLGAFPERIADRPESFIVPWDMRPEDINDWFALSGGKGPGLEKSAGRTPASTTGRTICRRSMPRRRAKPARLQRDCSRPPNKTAPMWSGKRRCSASCFTPSKTPAALRPAGCETGREGGARPSRQDSSTDIVRRRPKGFLRAPSARPGRRGGLVLPPQW